MVLPELSSLEFDALARGRCPQCACQDWIMGPRGGMAQNFECVGCHHRFNIVIWRGDVVSAQHIGHRDGGSDWSQYGGVTCQFSEAESDDRRGDD